MFLIFGFLMPNCCQRIFKFNIILKRRHYSSRKNSDYNTKASHFDDIGGPMTKKSVILLILHKNWMKMTKWAYALLSLKGF